jgi:starch phosphorylase
MKITDYSLEVTPRIPAALARLGELSRNLMYSWDRSVRALFHRLDHHLWETSGHNPVVFLRRVDERRLEAAAADPVFMHEYHRVLLQWDSYMERPMDATRRAHLEVGLGPVAYFCAEFGLHESLPLYSGGLGILAGDHCKAASDLGLPLVAVGLLYRQGYFTQEIDASGRQQALYAPTHFEDLPLEKLTGSDGQALVLSIEWPDRDIYLQVWRAHIGHVELFLLDTDVDQNQDADRRITGQLYGGDRACRLLQEWVLGAGGARLLRALDLHPTVWHINEGHAAFSILERMRDHQTRVPVEFAEALEVVAAATVFTTHTPVPAGHDLFDHALLLPVFEVLAKEMRTTPETLFELGRSPLGEGLFNMTSLGLRGSRFHNGVSRLHGDVASDMEAYVWPQVPACENPLRYVTNGVHVGTFLATEWMNLFDLHFGDGWRSELTRSGYWNRIRQLPDHACWSVRQSLKTRLREAVHTRIEAQWRRNGMSETQIRRLLAPLMDTRTDTLFLGFARRFATYKRALLLFSDLGQARALFGDKERPVLLIMAGKAHPNDQPAQELIQRLHDISRMPEFAGKILLVENYDMALARSLVAGVDVWMNTPAWPQEASGTSGQKAAINGVLNVSVLDGWWAEAFNGRNGWAITPHGSDFDPAYRDHEEATELLEVLKNEVIPCYFRQDGPGYSLAWMERVKSSILTLLPQFNAERMVLEYVDGFYGPAARHGILLAENGAAHARTLSEWKQRVRSRWPGVTLERLDVVSASLHREDPLAVDVAVSLNGLHPDDILLDIIFGQTGPGREFSRSARESFAFARYLEDGRALFRFSGKAPAPGLLHYRVRAYPWHPLLGQRFETGCMTWL